MLYFIRIISNSKPEQFISCKHYLSGLDLYKTIVSIYKETGVVSDVVVQFIKIDYDPCFRFFQETDLISLVKSHYIDKLNFDVVREDFIAKKEINLNE